ncbi:ATP-binding cassette domain-containing protein [Terrilactibacillus sp. BCM23-1]|uniref:ATP-binding cassette domain-containing protein n=1 Tax=Terrilactibacillus tamarindi TaxID=2599694 RepID=A0A6N8CNM3_9BACI|nr:metal ABC transporter ATP-binding protein [Terrilactibacillus tamarindi]MTT30435.1 ATP-binding cassette domain-containing protein [Terrilactibacillus tamarindi]
MFKTLDVDHINVIFNGERILKDLSFSVHKGEMLGVIGPNGAGKSTLLKVILGLITPQEGKVSIQSTNKKPVIGYVPQSRLIDADMPIRAWDFVSLGLPNMIRPWLTRRERNKVSKMMEETDTIHLAMKPIGKLSGGEKQRVYLAQALARDPDVLLLDESTSNLDPDAQEAMTSLVHHLCESRNIGIIFISHDLHLVKKYAHRILHMTRGQYIIGKTEEIMKDEKELSLCLHPPYSDESITSVDQQINQEINDERIRTY